VTVKSRCPSRLTARRHANDTTLRKSGNPVVVNVSGSLGSFWAVTNPGRRESHYPTDGPTGTFQENGGELAW
jgi:hypothetical protein